MGFEVGTELVCGGCFMKRAERRRALTGDERTRLKEAVKEELAGVLPREALRGELEASMVRLMKGEADYEEEIGRIVNAVERLAGLAMCREVLSVLDALQAATLEQSEEIRKKMRRLASL